MDRKNVNQLGRTKTKGVAAILLAFALIMGSFVVPVTSEGGNPSVTVVEAATKKDKKKPVIKFSGKSKITIEKNKVVKIPKTTAKDNKGGNVTKKIGVTVKKGKTSYKSIAKKIKKNKKVKFASVGKYTITYTVKDKAGNKATKKRYVTVVDSSKKTETSDETTQTTTQQTTEEVSSEQQTTEQPSTEKIEIEEVVVNNVTYKTSKDLGLYGEVIGAVGRKGTEIPTITIENDYSDLYFNKTSKLQENSQYLKFLGNIKATDSKGNDITDNIIIYEVNLIPGMNSSGSFDNDPLMYLYVKDNAGNSKTLLLHLHFRDYIVGGNYGQTLENPIFLSEDPVVIAELRNQEQLTQSTSLSVVVKKLTAVHVY